MCENVKMKNNWVSLLASVLSIIALIVTFLRIDITISNDAFIGIIASFIGACATIIVGAQIYNSVEAKRLIRDVENRQNRLDENIEKSYKIMGVVESNVKKLDSQMDDINMKIQLVNNRSNDLFSFSAFTQGCLLKEEKPMAAYKNFIDALWWGMGSEQKLVIIPSLNFMNEIVENLNMMNISKNITEKWNYQINEISVSLNQLKNHSKYEEISKRIELIEKQRIEIVAKIYNDNHNNNKG